MPSSCPIDYYKYHLFDSIVKMKKKQQCSGLSATSIDEFVRLLNSSKLYIYIYIYMYYYFYYIPFFQNNHYLIIINIAGCGFFFCYCFFISTTIKKKLV